MNTGWKEIAGDTSEPKVKDIYSQETSTWWKGHNNRIWFQTKDDVMMEQNVVRRAQIEILKPRIESEEIDSKLSNY